MDDVLSLRDVWRDYGGLEAVRGVSLDISRGEVHALVGQHGAGKTTLALLISGMLKPRTGTITFCGKRHGSLNLPLSNRMGIKMVYQQLCLNDNFTVAENLFAHDRRVNSFAWGSSRRVNAAAAGLMERYSFGIDPTAKLRRLSLSERAVVDILKQVYSNPVLLVLDEALEKLTPSALSRIVPILLERVKQGMSILFITHRIDDVYSFADKVSIIRDGKLIFTGATSDIDNVRLVRLAYTQFSAQEGTSPTTAEFTRFLRYNEAILEHLPIGLLVTDAEDRVKLANTFFTDAFSLSEGAYRNRPVADLLSGMSGATTGELTAALRSRADHELFNVGLRIGARMTLNNIKTLPVWDGGQHIGNILVIEDITEYDKLQKKVMLTDKLASVGLLAAGVAHEINNPLEIITNYLAALRRHDSSPDAQETVAKLGEEISYISTIVSDLVNLADAGRVATEEIDLNEAIARILGLLRESALSRKIHIDFAPGKGEVRAVVNANEVKQVILNLMKNAFEAMPNGGTIAVSTAEAIVDGRLTAIVRVDDDGPGISAADLNDVFLPFYTTKKHNGANAGLGLSVSYSILARYGGKLTAENLRGRGCRFTIALPQHPRAEPPSAQAGR
jgi:signal transduction histidine kinase/ABC-type branched-subunit amino acid transport system ATPase component